MKNWNWFHWTLVIIGLLILIYIFNPSVRQWICRMRNKFKKQGDKCSNCETSDSGVIVESGECVPEAQVTYDTCVKTNAALKDGADCTGCGSSPAGATPEDFSGKGVIISGKCNALPDAFAGKLCVPSSATVTPSALSYKRILMPGQVSSEDPSYQFFKNNGNTVSQNGSTLSDTEITKDDYVQAYVQTIKPCPSGQIKV